MLRPLIAPDASLFRLATQIEERDPRHVREFAIAALPSANVSRLGLGQRPTILKQNAKIKCRGCVATFVGAPERRLGLGQRAMVGEKNAELYGGGIVATSGRATVRGRSLIQCPALPEQHGQLERSVGIATLIGATIRRLGLGQRPLLFEQSTEVRGGGAMATPVGVTTGRMRFDNAPLAGELLAEVESAGALGRLGRIVRSSPRRPAVCAVADSGPTGFGAISVGANVVGVGRLREDGLARGAAGRTAHRGDERASNDYQRERDRQTGQDEHPRHTSGAMPVG
jgi:hypothetical protein